MSDDYFAALVASVHSLLLAAKPADDPFPGVAILALAEWLTPAGQSLKGAAEEGHRKFEATVADLCEVGARSAVILAGVADSPMLEQADYVAFPPFRLRKFEFDASGTAWPIEQEQGIPYRHVRVFLPAEYEFVRSRDGKLEPLATQPPRQDLAPQRAKGGGGRPPEYPWESFRKELIRGAFAGEFLNRRQIREHMTDWCSVNWTKQPDERTLRAEVSKLLPDEIREE